MNRSMNRDRNFRLFQARRNTTLHHERGKKGRRAGDAVLAMDQYPFAFVRLFPQPNQSFPDTLGRDGSSIRRRNPLVRLARMFRSLVAPRWPVSVGPANVEYRRDPLRIVAGK